MIRSYLILISLLVFATSALAETVQVDLTSGHLNVRTDASKGNKKCARVYRGNKLKVVGQSNGWYKVKINKGSCGGYGWIHSYYTKGKYKGVRGKTEAEYCANCSVITSSNHPHEPLPIPKFNANSDSIDRAYKAFLAQGVPANALKETLSFYQDNLSHNGGLKQTQCLRNNSKTLKQGIRNQRYVMLIDYRKKSGDKRAFMLDMKTHKVKSFVVSHGRNSGSIAGRPTKFTNGIKVETGTTLLGPHITGGGLTHGGNGLPGIWLDGVSWSNNSAREQEKFTHIGKNGRKRGQGYYVSKNNAKRSLGCPAFSYNDFMNQVYPKLKGGALWYHYADDSAYKNNVTKTRSGVQGTLKKGC